MKRSVLLFVGPCLLILSCTQGGADHSTAHHPDSLRASLIRTNHEMLELGNIDIVDEVFAEDYSGGGLDMMKSYIQSMNTMFPDIEVSIDPIVVEGNTVAWQRIHTATHQQPVMGFPPTGEKITWRTMFFSQYNEEGKVTGDVYLSNLYEVLHRNSLKSDTSSTNPSGE